VPVLIIALVAVVALVIVAGAAILLLSRGDDSSGDPVTTQAAPVPAPTPERPARPRERPSPYSVSAVSEGLRQIRREANGREAFTLRVDESGITAIVKGKVIVYRDGKLQTFPGPRTTLGTFDLGSVDAAAPSRIYRAVREKGKRLDYMAYVSNAALTEDMWNVATGQGSAYYRADVSGRNLCPAGKQC
jgi:hypothetical protein